MLRMSARALVLSVLMGLFAVALACGSDDDAAPPEADQEPTAVTASVQEPAATATTVPETKTTGEIKLYTAPPAMTIDPGKRYTATIEMAKGGRIVLELFAEEAPITVNNFAFLARDGYYDGVTFHRVLQGFMAQSGDPTGTGGGNPGYVFEDEFSPNLRHDQPGTLSMANRGPGTNGAQFFITFAPTQHLDDAHTVFGRVIEGMDVLNGITLRDPATATTPGDVITTVTIEEKNGQAGVDY